MFDNLPLWPARASTTAGSVDALYIFLVALSLFVSVAIFTMICIFALRYRRRKGREAEQIEGSNILELTWSAIPLAIFLFIFAWGAVVYFKERTPPRGATQIYVVAKQWMWKLQHEEGQREINELHVPVGRDVEMIMTSQDVIHSFYVPAFRIKQDVLPGRYTTLWFHATRSGTYHLFCAEYCGTQHSGMIGQVVVMEPAQYQAWLGGGTTTGSLAQSGQTLFEQFGCNTCHRFDVQGRGPNLKGLFGKTVQLEDGRSAAADHRPQAHFSSVSGLDYFFLLHRWFFCITDPTRVADAGRRSGAGRHLQQAFHDARPDDDLFLPDPVDSRRARQLPGSHDDW